MANPTIPMVLVGGVDDADKWGPGGCKLGRPLNRRTTRHLQSAYDGWAVRERLAQLEDMDWRLFTAATMRLRRQPVKDIAARLKCSLRQAYYLTNRAMQIVVPDGAVEEAGYESRLRTLEEIDPQAWLVYQLVGYRWHMQRIALQLRVPLRTVERAHAKAKKYVGDYRRDIARRYAREVKAALQKVAV